MIQIGSKVRVKDEAWKNYLVSNNQDASRQNLVRTVEEMPAQTPFHESVMLSGLFWWFNEADVEEV